MTGKAGSLTPGPFPAREGVTHVGRRGPSHSPRHTNDGARLCAPTAPHSLGGKGGGGLGFPAPLVYTALLVAMAAGGPQRASGRLGRGRMAETERGAQLVVIGSSAGGIEALSILVS